MPFLARYAGMNIAAGQLVAAFGSADRFRRASPSCPAPTPGLTGCSSRRWRWTSAWGRSCTSPRRWPGTPSLSIAAGDEPPSGPRLAGRPTR